MTHAEPRGPMGAAEWIRTLRVGEARCIGGGFVSAGPGTLASGQPTAARGRASRQPQAGPSTGPQTQLLSMLHRPC